MKLQTISEADFATEARKLNASVVKTGVADLKDLVHDPHLTVSLIRQGMMARGLIFTNRGWVEKFLRQWHLLDEDTLERIFEDVYDDLLKRVQRMRAEGVMSVDIVLTEATLSSVGSFLAKLAKFAFILIKLLAAARGGTKGLNSEQIAELGVLNPYAVYQLTKNLQTVSQKALKARKP